MKVVIYSDSNPVWHPLKLLVVGGLAVLTISSVNNFLQTPPETTYANDPPPSVIMRSHPESDTSQIVPLDAGKAANMVRYFNIQTHKRVGRWMVGDEPERHGIGPLSYTKEFVAVYNAMKAVDPTIEIGGPMTAGFDREYIRYFLKTAATRVDFVIYHPEPYDDYQANLWRLHDWISQYAPARSGQIDLQIAL